MLSNWRGEVAQSVPGIDFLTEGLTTGCQDDRSGFQLLPRADKALLLLRPFQCQP